MTNQGFEYYIGLLESQENDFYLQAAALEYLLQSITLEANRLSAVSTVVEEQLCELRGRVDRLEATERSRNATTLWPGG